MKLHSKTSSNGTWSESILAGKIFPFFILWHIVKDMVIVFLQINCHELKIFLADFLVYLFFDTWLIEYSPFPLTTSVLTRDFLVLAD
jgi:hypothetical protein